jgi:hypothetical protein
MLHQVVRTIVPELSLRHLFHRWNEIRTALAESPRQRILQVESMTLTS